MRTHQPVGDGKVPDKVPPLPSGVKTPVIETVEDAVQVYTYLEMVQQRAIVRRLCAKFKCGPKELESRVDELVAFIKQYENHPHH
jgi:hypothetical protein